ncbi:class I SAM-dependent DNA methyltransferase [Salmonirosea aquatica]|uniref:Methyltransferase domain-containing protein n=1 Tax=Salmonirosea aquatica TaxID=2654236 RepID=A0A7C9FXE2_9BACT|nr:methyltransferase domain-containing protein [Cytophagaceae bacterium SJW1-29]
MNTAQAYDLWSEQYDTNLNKTRDLEGQALRITLAEVPFDNALEMGCGTGKNTEWLITKARHTTAVDLSTEMLAKARQKINSDTVEFHQADMTQPWTFADGNYNLVTFSLVLEHIEDLGPVFQKTTAVLLPGGYVYVGELHPFKQYSGSKARFDTAEGTQVVPCFTHHISDFVQTAKKYGLQLVDMNEYFDENIRTTVPRVLTLLFKKS